MIQLPDPPYYAVIFTAQTGDNLEGYAEMSESLRIEAEKLPDFLGIESAGEGFEITVSYWKSMEAIQIWKTNANHLVAKKWGLETGYLETRSQICLVEKKYGHSR
jgi:heme-degrading monooxygenase HmoA